jgi:hypothetical protein
MKKDAKEVLVKMWSYAESLLKVLNEMIEREPNWERMGRLSYLLQKLNRSYDELRIALLQSSKGGSTLPAEGKPPMGEGKEREVVKW